MKIKNGTNLFYLTDGRIVLTDDSEIDGTDYIIRFQPNIHVKLSGCKRSPNNSQWQKIIATGSIDGSFKLSGLPFFVVPENNDIKILASRAGDRFLVSESDLPHKALISAGVYAGFIEGYKAAQEKGVFSLEDVKEALRVGVNIGIQNMNQPEVLNVPNFDQISAIKECKDFINSLSKPKQIQEIEFEMEQLNTMKVEHFIYSGQGQISTGQKYRLKTINHTKENPNGELVVKSIIF